MAIVTSTEQNLKDRLGIDLKLPIKGSFESISGVELLLQDIQQLLLTIPGERVNRPEFGCYLRNQIWENIGAAASSGASSIKNALDSFEPRITVLNVNSNINENTGLITFNIQFLINNTDTAINLIFPYRTGTALSFA